MFSGSDATPSRTASHDAKVIPIGFPGTMPNTTLMSPAARLFAVFSQVRVCAERTSHASLQNRLRSIKRYEQLFRQLPPTKSRCARSGPWKLASWLESGRTILRRAHSLPAKERRLNDCRREDRTAGASLGNGFYGLANRMAERGTRIMAPSIGSVSY